MITGCSWFTSCKDAVTYAELVEQEKGYISQWTIDNPYNIDFDHIISWDEEKLNNVTKHVLTDSIHPSNYLELNQWYSISEGDFKRLYFCIRSWGNDGVTDYNNEDELSAAMRNKKKFYNYRNVLVRYDSLYNISQFDYEEIKNNAKGDNSDPISFLICYNWNSSYYCNNYYGASYGTGSNYECTSGGIGFPIRFLWEGGKASIICPFSLVESAFSSYYYTMYYGKITYTQPNYLPK